MTHLDHIMVLHWDNLVVFLMELIMVCLMFQHCVSHFYLLMGLCLPLMKALDLALTMVNCLVSHFELIMDT